MHAQVRMGLRLPHTHCVCMSREVSSEYPNACCLLFVLILQHRPIVHVFSRLKERTHTQQPTCTRPLAHAGALPQPPARRPFLCPAQPVAGPPGQLPRGPPIARGHRSRSCRLPGGSRDSCDCTPGRHTLPRSTWHGRSRGGEQGRGGRQLPGAGGLGGGAVGRGGRDVR